MSRKQVVNLDSMNKLEVVKYVEKTMTQEFTKDLVSFYELLLNDALTLDDLEEIGNKYDIDVEELYYEKKQLEQLKEW